MPCLCVSISWCECLRVRTDTYTHEVFYALSVLQARLTMFPKLINVFATVFLIHYAWKGFSTTVLKQTVRFI